MGVTTQMVLWPFFSMDNRNFGLMKRKYKWKLSSERLCIVFSFFKLSHLYIAEILVIANCLHYLRHGREASRLRREQFRSTLDSEF